MRKLAGWFGLAVASHFTHFSPRPWASILTFREDMKDEISAAVDFLSKLVGKNQSLPREKVNEFRVTLTRVLDHKFKNHWFPDKPSKGQAYRCIRVNENTRRDPTLELVCQEIGIKYSDLMIPIELTLWIDPEEVACR